MGCTISAIVVDGSIGGVIRARTITGRWAESAQGQRTALVDQHDDPPEDGVALALRIKRGRGLAGQVGQAVRDGHHPFPGLGG